jgi:O-antigen/teichoic acid export membrane protein
MLSRQTPAFRTDAVPPAKSGPVAALLFRSSLTSTLRVATAGLGFLSSIILARVMTIEDYGTYIYWITVASVLTTISGLGISKLTMREVAAFRGANNREGLRSLLLYSIAFTIALNCIIVSASLFLLCSNELYIHLSAGYPWLKLLAISLLAIPLLHTFNLLGAIINGYEHVVPAQVLAATPAALNVLAGAFLLIWLPQGASAASMLWVQVANGLIMVVLSVTVVICLVRPAIEKIADFSWPNITQVMIWLRLGILFGTSQLLVNAITQIDVLMLGQLASPESVAHYQVASRIAYVVTFFYASVGMVIAPTLARLHANAPRDGLVRLVQRSAVAAWAGTAAIAGVALAFEHSILAMFGPQFAEARDAMLVLVVGWTIATAFGPAYTVLTMTGAVGVTVTGLGLAAILNVLLNLWLIPPLGASGAAWATLLSTVAFSIGFWLVVRCRLGFRTDILSLAFQPTARAAS